MVDVAIIGGGISGLATAYDLVARGLDVVVLERQVHAGGNAISERVGDFLMEHGPSTINAQSIAAHDISSRLGLSGEQCDLGAGVKSRYLVGRGRLQGIPVHPLGFVFSNYLSLKGRLRLLAEFAVPRYQGAKEETIAEFAGRRFGVEFAEKVIDPLVAGIYAGRAADLSVEAGFPKLHGLEQNYGSVAHGLVQHHRQGAKDMPSSRLFSYKNGVGSLPKALAQNLGARVRTGVTVRNIKKSSNSFNIDTGDHGNLAARAVVIATQPHVAAELLEDVDAPSSFAASEIQAPPLAVVYLGFERKNVEHPLDGLGFLAPESEKISMSGSQFCSTMFQGRAPNNSVAVAGYFGGARAPDLARLPANDLIEIARAEFSDLIGAKGEPLVARVRHWPRGLPQYRIGHIDRIATMLNAKQRVPGLYMTGNYICGPSVSVCVEQAGKTAVNVTNYLSDLIRSRISRWPKGGSLVRLIAVFLVLMLGLYSAAAPYAQESSASESKNQGAFELVSHLGKTVTNRDYLGKYMLVYFGYTYCPDVCPIDLQIISEAMDILGKKSEKIQPLFVTVNPERDTVKVIAEYVAHFHPRLVGLTGTKKQVASIMQVYRMQARKYYLPDGEPGEYLIDHSAAIVLIGPDGRGLSLFPHGITAEAIVADIKRYIGP